MSETTDAPQPGTTWRRTARAAHLPGVRIAYQPDWSASRPYATFDREGTAKGSYKTFDEAAGKIVPHLMEPAKGWTQMSPKPQADTPNG